MKQAGTAKVYNAINGTDLTSKNGKYHITSHCGSVQYDSDTSVTIGWGLHGAIDNIPAVAAQYIERSAVFLYRVETGMSSGIYRLQHGGRHNFL